MKNKLVFEVNFLGLGIDEESFVRKNRLDQTNLTLISYRVWWSEVVFRCPAFTLDISAYAIDFLFWIVEALDVISAGGSIDLTMTGSGDTVSFVQVADWVTVSLDRGSIEVERAELVRDFSECAAAAFTKVVGRYPDLGKRPELQALSRRIDRLRSGRVAE